MDKDLETGRMARQFEKTQYTNDGEEFKDIRVAHVVRQFLFEDVNSIECKKGYM